MRSAVPALDLIILDAVGYIRSKVYTGVLDFILSDYTAAHARRRLPEKVYRSLLLPIDPQEAFLVFQITDIQLGKECWRELLLAKQLGF